MCAVKKTDANPAAIGNGGFRYELQHGVDVLDRCAGHDDRNGWSGCSGIPPIEAVSEGSVVTN